MHYRPRVIGNPLDPATRPTLPKPLVYTEVVEENGALLRLEDHKLLNVLLALSWDRLGDEVVSVEPFQAKAADLRRAIGQATSTDNRRLRQSLERLRKTLVRFTRKRKDQSLVDAVTGLISYHGLERGGDTVEWDFDPRLKPHLREPGEWAWIHLDVCLQFRKKPGLILYELLSGKVRLNHPEWSVSTDHFRRIMGAVDKMSNFAQLERRVIIPAIEEVHEFSSYRVDYRRHSEKGSKAVTSLTFSVKDTAAAVHNDTASARKAA